MKITILALLLLSSISKLDAQGIYSFNLPLSGQNDSLQLASFQGKKILLVNTASQSIYAGQFAELEQLYQQFKDSGLVVVACPSNSFAHEPLGNDIIATWYANELRVSFPVTAKINITGEDADPLYKWLADKDSNGVMKARPRSDFMKLLINSQGQIVGYFDGSISPLDDAVLRAIRIN